METYKVHIYPVAKRDFKEIINYLNTLSSDSALKYYDLIVEKIGSLSQMPTRCPLVHNPVLRKKGYRFLIVKSYVVFFVVDDHMVQIRRILYSKQNYEEFL